MLSLRSRHHTIAIPKMKSYRAFSLLEMLIVLSITAILLMNALPSWQGFLTRTDEALWQARLLETISYASAAAHAEHSTIILCHSKDGQDCNGAWTDGWLVMNEQQKILRYVQLPASSAQLIWHSYPYYRDYLLFEANFVMGNVEGVFRFCFPDQSLPAWVIVFNRAGRARVLTQQEKKNYSCKLPTTS